MNRILIRVEELNNENICSWQADDYRARHLRQILQAKCGQSFEAGILHSQISGQLTIVEQRADGSLLGQFTGGTDLQQIRCWQNLSLGLGLVRPPVLKRLLRDLASAGVKDIYLIQAQLCEGDYRKSHIWNELEQYLILGAEQGRLNRLPRLWSVRGGISLTEFLQETRQAVLRKEIPLEHCIVFAQNGSLLQPPKEAEAEVGAPLLYTMALGPERGWTEREMQQFAAAKFSVRSFGPATLRTEVAAHLALGYYLLQASFLQTNFKTGE